MNVKLIYILFFSFAACMVASCSDDTPDVKADDGRELTFDVAEQSRATSMTTLNFSDSKFAVYGDMKFMDNDPIVVFDKTIVRYVDGKWRYNDTQYWFPKHLHSFIALYPAVATGLTEPEYQNTRLSFTYTLPDDFKAATDLMVATHRRMYADTPSATTPVTLGFGHIMSRINFDVKNDAAADNVRVTKIVLEGINKKGSFTISPAPLLSGSGQTDDYTSAWSDISNKGTLTADINVNIPEDEVRPLFPDDNALFMVPQPDNHGVIMSITYTLYDAGAQPEEQTMIARTPIGGWEPGKIYTYTIAIEETTKEIYLTVSVKPWQTPKGAAIIVPES